MNKLPAAALTVLMAALLSGCDAAPAVAPRDDVQATRYRAFPSAGFDRGRLVFNDVKFFLWKENMTREDVLVASHVADEMETQERLGFEAERERQAVRAGRSDMDEWLALHDQRDYLVEGERAGLLQQRDEELAREPSLRAQDVIAACEARIADIDREVVALDARLTEVGDRVDAPSGGRGLGPFREAYLGPYERKVAAARRGAELVREIQAATDWYINQPSRVSFRFLRDGSIDAKISEWNLGDGRGKRDFSTLDGTLREVAYQAVGGRFTFDAYVLGQDGGVLERYAFKLSRARYEIEDRVYMAGTIKKYDAAGNLLRQGVVKLVDKKYGE